MRWGVARRDIAILCAGLAGLAGCGRVQAFEFDYQLHGFAAQGYVVSNGNNLFGHSTGGSSRYYEAALSGIAQLYPDLLFSAQGLIRDAGATDDGRPRLDHALLDYRPLSGGGTELGLRLGRVKLPLGFYNDTRDSIFARPSIQLAESVYNETQSQRSLLFSADGVQTYGVLSAGSYAVSLTGTGALERELPDWQKRLLIDLGGAPFDLSITELWNGQLAAESGPWRLAYSQTYLRLALETAPDVGVAGDFGVRLDVISAAWLGENLSLTAEYARNPNKQTVHLGDQVEGSKVTADGGYLQAEYRFPPSWSVLARYDAVFGDRDDRRGEDYAAANPGVAAYSGFARDFTLGASWRSARHWGVWAEVHWIDGTLTVQPHDNPGGANDRYWSTLLLMAAYRF